MCVNTHTSQIVLYTTDVKSCSNRTCCAATVHGACIDIRFEQDLHAAARWRHGHVHNRSRPHTVFGGAPSRALASDGQQTCWDVVRGLAIKTCGRGGGPNVRPSAPNPTDSRIFSNVAIDCKSLCAHKSCSNRSRNIVHEYGARFGR